MTRALEVRLFWGDALLDVQHHPLREGLLLKSSAMLEASIEMEMTLAALEGGALSLTGVRHGALNVLQHEGLSFVMEVVETTPLESGPREGQPLASACLLAMALHLSLLAAGMTSPQSDALAIDGLPRPLPPLPPRNATVLTAGANPSTGVAGVPEATVSPSSGGPTTHSTRRGGSRSVANPVRPDVLAMLGGAFARLGSGAGGYDASSVMGAPSPNLIPDDGPSMMSGAGGGTCGPPPMGCNGSISFGARFNAGSRTSVLPEPALTNRCRSGDECGHVPRIVRCGDGCRTVHGSLSREVVRRIVRRHHNEIAYCYERALQSRPDSEGRVSTSFIIDAHGTVIHAEASSDALPEVTECIERALSRARFPESDGVTGVNYPFDFTRSE